MKTRARILLAGVLPTPGLAGICSTPPRTGISFVPDRWQPGAADALSLGSLGTSPPGFAQVLPFILITAAIPAPGHFRLLPVRLRCFGADRPFEPVQQDARGAIAECVPVWLQQVFIPENTRACPLAGTFDPMDMLSIAAGSLATSMVPHIFRSGGYEHEH